VETCAFKLNTPVQFTLDEDPNHIYIVLDAISVPNQNGCVYEIELKTDSSMKFKNVPESYMTDTIP
jgi:hypothetical protein